MRCDLGEIEKEARDKARKSTEAFTASLLQHHPELYGGPMPEPEEELQPEQSKMLPPIPNQMIAVAVELAFPKPILNRVEAVQRATLREYPGLNMIDMKSQRRTKQVVRARQIAMYVSKTTTPFSLPEIGRRFGGRDHTTVLHAVRKITALVEHDASLATQIERIKDWIPAIGLEPTVVIA